MNQRLINKIKLFDKLASEALIAKKAGIFSVSEEEKKQAFSKAKKEVKRKIRKSYNDLISYAPTEAAFQEYVKKGLTHGSNTREEYIQPFLRDEYLEDEIRRDSDIKTAVKGGYLSNSDVNILVQIAKDYRDEIVSDLRRMTNEEKNPKPAGPKLPQSNLATTPSYQGSGSTVKKTQSDFSERDLAEYQRVEANSQAKQYADGIWNSTKQARESGPQGIQKAKEAIQGVINNSSREANNISSSMFNRFKNLRIIQILSTYLKTIR